MLDILLMCTAHSRAARPAKLHCMDFPKFAGHAKSRSLELNAFAPAVQESQILGLAHNSAWSACSEITLEQNRP